MPRKTAAASLDRALSHLSPAERWHEWMRRIEAVLFASATPVPRAVLARVVGEECRLDLLIDALRDDLADRPYEIISVAGAFQMRTRPRFAAAIRAAGVAPEAPDDLSRADMLALMTIAYFQPVTRAEMTAILGQEISRDRIGRLRRLDLVASGPRSPRPGAPQTYVTTTAFLARWDLESLRDLPQREELEAAGLLSRDTVLDVVGALRDRWEDMDPVGEEEEEGI